MKSFWIRSLFTVAGVLFILQANARGGGALNRVQRDGRGTGTHSDGYGTFFTDTHGAMGALKALMASQQYNQENVQYIEGTLRWLHKVATKTEDGGLAWKRIVPEAGDPAPKRNSEAPDVAMRLACILAEYDPKLERSLHKTLYEGAMKSLEAHEKVAATRSGKAHWLPKRIHEKNPTGLGYAYGGGGIMGRMAGLYAITGDARAKRWAVGMARLLKENAIEWQDEGLRLATWKLHPSRMAGFGGAPRTYIGKTDTRTGFCWGAAGTAYGLLEFHAVFQNFRFHDETSAMDLACAALNWLLTQQVQNRFGTTYRDIRYDGVGLRSPGLGSGSAGIGAAFASAYDKIKDQDADLAAIYCEAVKTSAAYACNFILDAKLNLSTYRESGGSYRYPLNLGLCGGLGGTALFLIDVLDVITPSDPALARRCQRTIQRIGEMYRESSIPCADGAVVWASRPWYGGDKTLEMAADYGITGFIQVLSKIAGHLEAADFQVLTRQAARGMISKAVIAKDGVKWPRYSRL